MFERFERKISRDYRGRAMYIFALTAAEKSEELGGN